MKFEEFGLDNSVVRNIEKLGFKRPTDIQYKSMKPILKGEDVLAIAQTGTGKTAAFTIPILHILKNRRVQKRPNCVRCLIMVPTHELAYQLCEVIKQLAKKTGITTLALIGGVSQEEQIDTLEKGCDIVIATPGRMFDLVSQKHLNLGRTEILVLDEADHMLDLGFIKDIRQMMRFLPERRQTLFFSATITPKIKKLAYSIVHNPIRIQISPKNPVAKNITHSVAFVEMDNKRFFLERMINDNPESKILVFVRTKVRAERVHKAMERVSIETVTIHSDKSQDERNSALSLFKKGEVKILIATDVSARGIDIPSVDYVINYDLPDKDENYVHRVGRTGRGTQKGIAFSFCSDNEREMLAAIEEYTGSKITIAEVDKKELADTLDYSKEKSETWQDILALDDDNALDFDENSKKKGKKKSKKKKRK